MLKIMPLRDRLVLSFMSAGKPIRQKEIINLYEKS